MLARRNKTCRFHSSERINNNDDVTVHNKKHEDSSVAKDSQVLHPVMTTNTAEMLGIKPELYKHSAEIDLPPSRIGRVWFKLVYDGAVETLTVEILKVKQLLPRDHSNTPRDSFVKLFLLPDERFSQQTKVRPRSNNPTFGEKFVFQVSNSELRRRCLRLSVYDAGKGGRHLVGHALVTLKEIDPKEGEYLWRDLDDIAHTGDTGTSIGELNVGLSYIPTLSRLNVVVGKARNLRKVDLQSNGIYVKIALTQGHSTVKTKITSTLDGALDLNFDESFSFKVPPEDLDKSCLSIMVLTTRSRGSVRQIATSLKNVVTKGKYRNNCSKYGRIAVGSFMYCRNLQLMHWQEAISKKCQVVYKWHPLSEVIETL